MYRSTDGTQRYSCKHAETDPTVAEVSIVYVHVYVGSRVRVFYRITVLRVLPPLGVTAREEEGGKIEKKRGKKGRKGGKERQERRGEEEEEG